MSQIVRRLDRSIIRLNLSLSVFLFVRNPLLLLILRARKMGDVNAGGSHDDKLVREAKAILSLSEREGLQEHIQKAGQARMSP